MKNLILSLGLLFIVSTSAFSQLNVTAGKTWQFAFSGDSRNCGDVVMPAIAQDISKTNARFYLHLGDIRAVFDFDEDIIHRAGAPQHLSIYDYENAVWRDMIENQIDRFKVPFFLGIGNHESISPKTRADYLIQFADWLNSPVLQAQRLKDDPNDHKLRAYFHWQMGGVDFIYLDNATTDQFDTAQLAWFNKVIDRDDVDPNITTVVVGMHEALPDSLSFEHSMSDYPTGEYSGKLVYQRLLRSRDQAHKLVYVLASHSHFLMDNIYNSEYWRANGGVLPGWIVGTAGAIRYKLPRDANKYSPIARTNIYGYMLATVNPPGQPRGSIKFDFHEIKQPDVPADVRTKFGPDLVKWCFDQNISTQ
jgi:hypothetical protein